jgi:hypothetical protein
MHVIATVSAANSAVTAILFESHGHLIWYQKKHLVGFVMISFITSLWEENLVMRCLKTISIYILISGLYACGGSGGSGGSGGANLTDPAVPSTPGGLTAQVVSSTQINLNWNPATDDVAVLGYYVYGEGNPVTTSTSYSFIGLTPATQYCFSVAAYDGDGNTSPQSAAVCASTPAAASSAWTTVRSGTDNELSNIVWTGDKLLVVEETFGSSTTVHTSTDGLIWDDYPTSGFAFNGATDVVFGGNQYVAVDSWFFVSPDGIAWELVTTDLTDATALAWSPTLSLYVAVGEAGYIATSTDGRSWNTIDPAPTTSSLYGAAWLNGRFYAVGEAGIILTSGNGLDWSVATTPAYTFDLESIAWNGLSGAESLYVATGYGMAFRSIDGDIWVEAAASPPGFNDSVIWGGGSANCFVAVGLSGNIFSSTDGETWTRRFLDADPVYAQLDLREVAWNGTRFVAVGQQGTLLVSDDCITWSIVASGADLRGLAHDGSRFIAVGDNGRVAVSSDADTWEYRHTGDDSHYLYDLVWDGSRYLAVGQTYSLRSDDLYSWLASWEGATSVDTAVVWDGSQFVKTTDYGILIWDGVTLHTGTEDPWWQWSLFDSSYPYPVLNDIIWASSQFVAVGNNGRIYTSPDATETSTWTEQASGTTSNLEAVAEGAGRLVTVGAAGTILTSDNGGVTWAVQDSGSSDTIYDVTWTGSRFVAVGYSGLILTSSDGNIWAVAFHGKDHLFSVLSEGAHTVITGANGTILRNNQ